MKSVIPNLHKFCHEYHKYTFMIRKDLCTNLCLIRDKVSSYAKNFPNTSALLRPVEICYEICIMVKKPKHIPTSAGVYIFKKTDGTPLYVGKAGNLKNRLVFYFSRSPKSPRLQKLLVEAKKLEIVEAESEIAALIREAELIKKHLPKYNVLMRDDKNYFYAGITDEKFPRIFLTHQPYAERGLSNVESRKKPSSAFHHPPSRYIGPFTDGGALKITLRLLRRIFPYCTCKETHKRPCLNTEIGRCVGYCCYDNYGKTQRRKQQKEYLKNIHNIETVLNGKTNALLRRLKKEMRGAAKKQEYENAAVLRDQVEGLESIFAHRFVLCQPLKTHVLPADEHTERELQNLLATKREIRRIEGYDISNISGTDAVGSMVVFTRNTHGGYRPDKNQYRKFRIKTVHKISDVDMIHEVVLRRLAHLEWQCPDLIIVDGGKQQFNAVLNAIRQFSISNFQFSNKQFKIQNSKFKIPIIMALAKREEELYIKNRRLPIQLKKQLQEILHLFQRIRDESHRFAKRYHHKRREMFFKKQKGV